MRHWSYGLVGVLLLGLVLACNTRRDLDDDDDDTADDDDSASGDDDDSALGDDDDFGFEDPPVFLAAYDFSLVMLENKASGVYQAVHGTMDISVSQTAFLAEIETDTGATWDLGGSLDQNANQFLVAGWILPPGGTKEVWVEAAGNFLADADGTPSESCLVGIGEDDDPNFPNQGIEFAWYGCQQEAPPPAIDRTGTHSIVVTVHADNCLAGWTAATWTETWQFNGRNLIVSRESHVGYGVVSDDGNVFHFTTIEQESPGRSLKVLGNFTNPNGTTVGRATGHCEANTTDQVGGVLDLAY